MENKTEAILIIGIIVIVLIGIVAYFGFHSGYVVKEDTIKIGWMGPLTGDAGQMGSNVRIATGIAVEEINNNGGINGKKIEVIYEDDKCDPKEAVNAANKLINVDKVSVILGGYCSGETLSAAPLADSTKTVLFSYGSSSPKITNAGDYVFRDYPSDAYQGKIAAEYLYNDLGKRRVAVFYWLGDWSVGIKEVFENRFKELGGEIITEESFQTGAKDLKTQLTKINSAKPDAIYLLGMPAETIIAFKQANELDMKIQFMGGDTWDDPKIPADAGSASDGAIFLTPYSPLTNDFKAKMKVATGNDEIIIGAPNAYDALHIIVDIMKKVGTDSTKIKNELYKIKGYNGVSGTITFDKNGDITSADYSIRKMSGGKTETIGRN